MSLLHPACSSPVPGVTVALKSWGSSFWRSRWGLQNIKGSSVEMTTQDTVELNYRQFEVFIPASWD